MLSCFELMFKYRESGDYNTHRSVKACARALGVGNTDLKYHLDKNDGHCFIFDDRGYRHYVTYYEEDIWNERYDELWARENGEEYYGG